MAKAKNKASLPNDYERMIPEYHKGGQIYGEHIARYKVLSEIVKGKKVLDIACGSGYGTAIIAESAKTVVGVDVSEESVKYAKDHYGRSNITYLQGDGEKIPCDDNSFDTIVTLETIEHIKDYKKFLSECKRVLKPDGLLLVSTPNDLEFAEGNHFHLHEFEHEELNKLLKGYFKNTKHYYQSTWLMNIVGEKKIMTEEWEAPLDTIQVAPIKPEQFLYFYFLCSDRDIVEEIPNTSAIGQHWSERGFQEHVQGLNYAIQQKEAEVLELNAKVDGLTNELKAAQEQIERITNHILTTPYRAARKIKRTAYKYKKSE